MKTTKPDILQRYTTAATNWDWLASLFWRQFYIILHPTTSQPLTGSNN